MIPQIQIKPGTRYIDFDWLPPRYMPDHYKVLALCTFATYAPEKISLCEPAESHNLTILNLHPGSVCKVVFQAIYNSATLDRGIRQTVELLSEGKEYFLMTFNNLLLYIHVACYCNFLLNIILLSVTSWPFKH